MASRYWVHGTGNWSDNAGHWAATSNGAEGASLPTSSDDVFIDSSSGFGSGGTISIDVNADCNNFTATSGHSYIITNNSTGFSLSVYGSLTLESGITWDITPLSFKATSTGKTITTAGVSVWYTEFVGVGGGWTLQDNLIVSNGKEFYQENGTFDANDKNVTANDFYFYAATGFTPTVVMGSGTWEATGEYSVWYVDQYSNQVVTFIPETSTIKLSGSTALYKRLVLYDNTGNEAGKTYNNLWLTGTGTGEFGIIGSNTFNDFKVDTPPHTIKFDGAITTTVTTFTVSGTVGNLISLDNYVVGRITEVEINNGGSGYDLNSNTVYVDGGNNDALVIIDAVDGNGVVTACSLDNGGSGYSVANNVTTTGGAGSGFKINIISVLTYQFTLSKSSGVVSCDYLNISNSNATGGASWYAGANSADTTNNTGWIFRDAPTSAPFPMHFRV